MPSNRVIIHSGRYTPNLKHQMGNRTIYANTLKSPALIHGGELSIGANQIVGIHSPAPSVMRFQDNNPAPPMPMRGGALLSGLNFGKKAVQKSKMKDDESNIRFLF
jgi:hypothetical protein